MTDAPARPTAYSYIRFSTPEQARGDSARRQMAKAEEYALLHGLELADDNYLDQGVSAYRGRNRSEGALADFLQAVKDGVVDQGSYLLVESMDRVSREKPRKAVRLLEDICESGITLVTLADGKEYTVDVLDNDPMAFMWAFMVAIRANEESETKSRRVREAWSKKKAGARESRAPITRRTPAWLTVSEDGRGFEVREERAAIVRRIFEEAAAGRGQHTIAHGLNCDDVPTFSDGKRVAQFWHRSYVAKLLRSPAVIGTYVPHAVREVSGKRVRDPLPPIHGYYPPIVPKPLYDRMQARLEGNSSPRMRAAKGEVSNILAGLAKCPCCSSAMTRVNKGKKGGTPYLVCTRAKGGAGCAYRQVRMSHVESAIRHAATRSLSHDIPSGDADIDARMQAAQASWDGTASMIDHLSAEIAEGSRSAAVRRKLAEAEATLAEIDEEIERLGDLMKRSGKRALARISARLDSTFSNPRSTLTECNAVLRDAFAACEVDHRDGSLRFHWLHGGLPSVIPYGIVED